MLIQDGVEALLFFLFISFLAFLLGEHVAHIIEGKKTWLSTCFEKVEKFLYSLLKVDPQKEMTLRAYLISLAWLHLWSFLLLSIIFLCQGFLPLNKEALPGLPFIAAAATSSSIITNTGWIDFSPETTLSIFSQMIGITVQNFIGPAVSLAVAFALIRSLAREGIATLGNLWVDLVRSLLYILIPLSLILSVLLIYQGVPETLTSRQTVHTLEGATQDLPLGPVASQISIQLLGSSGGGYYKSSTAHPYENPTLVTFWLELGALIIIPGSLPFAFGALTKRKTGFLFYSIGMCTLFSIGIILSFFSSYALEGIETRFGSFLTYFWSSVASGTGTGAFSADLVSLHPAATFFSLFNIITRQVFIGSVGIGFCYLTMYAILTLFTAGHMVGRTACFFGKKINSAKMQLALASLMIPCILTFLAIISFLPWLPIEKDPGSLSDVLYFFSAIVSNSSGPVANLPSNPYLYQLIIFYTLIGRATSIGFFLWIAANFSQSKKTPSSRGSCDAESFFFGIALFMIIVLSSLAIFFPLLSMGPLVEWTLFQPQLFERPV